MEAQARSRNVVIWGGIAVVVAVLLFLAGYVPQARQRGALSEERERQAKATMQLESELARTRVQRDLSRAQGKLGMVLYEVNRNNFASAAQRSTEFFEALREATGAQAFTFAVPRDEPYRAMLARRDEISADLARSDPAARQKLTDMYLQFEQALSR
jgi:hypothetical protein